MSNVITTNSADIPLKEKQVIFDTAAKTISIDIDGERIPLSGSPASSSGFEFEFSVDAADWHSEQTEEDKWLRLRAKGENDSAWSEPIRLFAGAKGEKGDKGDKGDPGSSALEEVYVPSAAYMDLSVEGGKRYVIGGRSDTDFPPETLTILSVEDSPLESEIVVTFASVFIQFSFPASLGWIGEPSFEAEKSYIVSIRHNIAVACEYIPGDDA